MESKRPRVVCYYERGKIKMQCEREKKDQSNNAIKQTKHRKLN